MGDQESDNEKTTSSESSSTTSSKSDGDSITSTELMELHQESDNETTSSSESSSTTSSESDRDSITSTELIELHNNISNDVNQSDTNANPTIIDNEPEQPNPRPQYQRKPPETMNITNTNQQSYSHVTIKECKQQIKKYQKHLIKLQECTAITRKTTKIQQRILHSSSQHGMQI